MFPPFLPPPEPRTSTPSPRLLIPTIMPPVVSSSSAARRSPSPPPPVVPLVGLLAAGKATRGGASCGLSVSLLLRWVNDFLKLSPGQIAPPLTNVSDVAAGFHAVLILDAIAHAANVKAGGPVVSSSSSSSTVVSVHNLRIGSVLTVDERLKNWCVFQSSLVLLSARKEMDVKRLAKGMATDCLDVLKWLKTLWDVHYCEVGGQEENASTERQHGLHGQHDIVRTSATVFKPEYDAAARMARAKPALNVHVPSASAAAAALAPRRKKAAAGYGNALHEEQRKTKKTKKVIMNKREEKTGQEKENDLDGDHQHHHQHQQQQQQQQHPPTSKLLSKAHPIVAAPRRQEEKQTQPPAKRDSSPSQRAPQKTDAAMLLLLRREDEDDDGAAAPLTTATSKQQAFKSPKRGGGGGGGGGGVGGSSSDNNSSSRDAAEAEAATTTTKSVARPSQQQQHHHHHHPGKALSLPTFEEPTMKDDALSSDPVSVARKYLRELLCCHPKIPSSSLFGREILALASSNEQGTVSVGGGVDKVYLLSELVSNPSQELSNGSRLSNATETSTVGGGGGGGGGGGILRRRSAPNSPRVTLSSSSFTLLANGQVSPGTVPLLAHFESLLASSSLSSRVGVTGKKSLPPSGLLAPGFSTAKNPEQQQQQYYSDGAPRRRVSIVSDPAQSSSLAAGVARGKDDSDDSSPPPA